MGHHPAQARAPRRVRDPRRAPLPRASAARGSRSRSRPCTPSRTRCTRRFVEGRVGAPLDVGIDTLGALVGVLLWVRLAANARPCAAHARIGRWIASTSPIASSTRCSSGSTASPASSSGSTRASRRTRGSSRSRRELRALNDSLNAVAYAALGQSPQVDGAARRVDSARERGRRCPRGARRSTSRADVLRRTTRALDPGSGRRARRSRPSRRRRASTRCCRCSSRRRGSGRRSAGLRPAVDVAAGDGAALRRGRTRRPAARGGRARGPCSSNEHAPS